MLKRSLSALSLAFIFATGVTAQEVEVDRYNITARIDAATSTLDSRASLALSNQSQSPKPKLYFRLTKLAKVTAATVNGAAAQVETADDRRVTTLNQVIITPQTPLAPGASATVEVSYRIEAPETSPLIHIYPGEVLLTPEAVWVPMPSTMFTLYGPNTAPITMAVTTASGVNLQAVSAGAVKGERSGQSVTFDQPLNSLPLIVAGSFDQPAVTERGGVRIEVYAQQGITAGASDLKAATQPSRTIVTRLGEEAGRVIDFLTGALGPPPAGATFRIVSSVRANNITVPGMLVLSEQTLRRDTLTEATIESLADSIARIWIDGRVRVRGQEQRSAQENRPAQRGRSAAFLRDSLPRYLAALYFESRFSKEAGRDAFARMRWSYTPVAQAGRDAELAVQTVALPTYSAAVFAKGPLVFRLIAETIGRDKFMAAIKSLLTGAQTKAVTTDDLRAALVKAGGPEAEKIFQQWIDTIVEPDIIIGAPLPSDKPGAQRVNLRNLGTGDMAVSVLAVTASGKQVTAAVTVPSENITSTDIPTAEKIASIEVDPDKLIVQTNYDNDAREGDMKSARLSSQTLFNQSIAAFNKGGYAEAEGKLREALRADPRNSVLHAWLARALAAQKKMDEAVTEANAALKIDPPVGSALAWAHITLGQAALARNQAAEAVQHLRRALVESEEAPAQFAAREALVQAGRAAGISYPVEESVRAFVTQFDAAIKQPSSDRLFPLVVRNNLKRFVQGLTVSRPTAWTTEILWADQVDANRVALDVGLKVRAEGRDQSGTAVFILSRAGQGWVLEDVQMFNVK